MEHGIQNQIRNAVASLAHVFRANVGRGWQGVVNRRAEGYVELRDARPFSTGLPVGFSDLFGWQSVTVTDDMVGTVIARFVAIEVKSDRGRVRPEQAAFIKAVNDAGGIAGIAHNESEAVSLLSPRLTMTTKETDGMTPEEFRAACERLGWRTVDEAAAKLQVTPRTVHNWRGGKAPIAGTAVLYLRLLEQTQPAQS